MENAVERLPAWMRFVESREKQKIVGVYHYRSIKDSSYCYTRLRLENKKFIYGRMENNRFIYGLSRNTPKKSFKAVYGDIRAIKQAITDGQTVFYVEGEKDCQTMQKYGYSSFTAGASGDWHSGLAELVRGADLVILQDNDSSGERLSEQIRNDVKGIAKNVKIIVPTPSIEKGDISDFFATNGKKEFEALIKQETVKEKSAGAAEQDNKSREEQVQEVYSLMYSLKNTGIVTHGNPTVILMEFLGGRTQTTWKPGEAKEY